MGDKKEGKYIKTTVVEDINSSTGEVLKAKRTTEVYNEVSKLNFLLWNTTDGFWYFKYLNGLKMQILMYMASQIVRDNTVNVSLSLIDEWAYQLFNKNGERLTRLTIQKNMKQMERDGIIVELWGGKWIINPRVIPHGGTKNYKVACALFNEAMKGRTKAFLTNKDARASLGGDWQRIVSNIADKFESDGAQW